MENLICPNCRKDFGIKADMHGTDVKACISCDSAFVVMYVAGFNDGLRAKAPALSGEVVKMGDLSLDGDKWTGLVISCPKDALRDVAVNLLGKTVVISAPGVSAPVPAGEAIKLLREFVQVYDSRGMSYELAIIYDKVMDYLRLSAPAPAGDVVEMAEDLRTYVKKYGDLKTYGTTCTCHLCDSIRLVEKWSKRLTAQKEVG